MAKRLWAWLTGGMVVWLMDHDGEQTRTIAYRQGFGLLKAKRFQYSREVTLHPGGKVTGSCYVEKWEFERPAQKEST